METRFRKASAQRATVGALVTMLMLGLALAVLPGSVALAVDVNKVYDTVADFNTGTLYHTGLTVDTVGGGDGNGEVRLLTVGINAATWNPGGTANDTALPARWGHTAVQYAGKIYVAGGNTSPLASNALDSVHYTTIKPDHNLANWIATTPLPGKRWLHGMAALDGYLYIIGGLDENAAPQAIVYKASINADGSVGAWTTNNVAPLPKALSDLAVQVLNGTIYVIGGDDNEVNPPDDKGAVKTVYVATPDGSGNIGSWASGSDLLRATSRHASAADAGRLYVAGGADFNNSLFYPYAYYGAASNTSISWTQTDPLPVNLVYAAGLAYAGQIYIVGGAFNDGASLEKNIRSNLMNSDGSLVVNGWQSSDVLSSARQRTAAVLSDDGWIYVIQGQSGDLNTGGTPLKTIDYGPTAAAGATVFAPSGTYTSSIFDIGTSRPIIRLIFNTNVPTGTTLSVEYRVSDFQDFQDAPAYVGALAGVTGDNIITVNATKRYMQFRANLTSNAGKDKSPVLNKVTITYDAPATPTPTATLTHTPGGPTETPTGTPTPTTTPNACSGKPPQPTLRSPANGKSVKVKKVPLAWDGSDCAKKYKVVIKLGSAKGKNVQKKKLTDPQMKTKALTKGKTYFWHVKACDGKLCSKWSEGWKFKVAKKGDPALNE